MQRRYVTVDVFTAARSAAIRSPWCWMPAAFRPRRCKPSQPSSTTPKRHLFCRRVTPPTTRKCVFSPRPGTFAGHPNVGTAFVLATRAPKTPMRLRFEEGAGLVPVEILQQSGKVVGAELTAPESLSKLTQFSAEKAAACGSLAGADISRERHSPMIVSVGLPFLVAALISRDALRRARPDAAAFARTFPCDGAVSIYLYTTDVPGEEKPCDLQARMFLRGSSGLVEDPATGSATVAAAALLADLAPEREGELKLRVGQGFDMGRPSLLLTRIRKEKGAVVSAHVGGGCVEMMEGTFRLAGEA